MLLPVHRQNRLTLSQKNSEVAAFAGFETAALL
jgi:hypothetical protein